MTFPAVNDGQWHHFVAISDARLTRLWDRTLSRWRQVWGHGHQTCDRREHQSPVHRRESGALAASGNGEIDDIAIWNRVLTPAEIAALFTGGAGTPPSLARFLVRQYLG